MTTEHTDWEAIAKNVAAAVRIIAPIAAGVAGPAGAGILIAAQIVAGAERGIPAAKALLDLINNGTTPSPEQLKAYLADYDDAHDDLNKAIIEAKARNAAKK